jgi:hypothetical protein
MLDVNTRIQILDELSHLAGARKHQFAAFCRKESSWCLPDQTNESIRCSSASMDGMSVSTSSAQTTRHCSLRQEKGDEEEGWVDEDADRERELGDLEEKIGAEEGSWEMREKRPTMLYAPLVSGLAIILCFLFIGSGMRQKNCPRQLVVWQNEISRCSQYRGDNRMGRSPSMRHHPLLPLHRLGYAKLGQGGLARSILRTFRIDGDRPIHAKRA